MWIVFFPGKSMGERFDDPALLGQAVANFLKENPMYRDDSIRIQTYA